MKEPLVSVLTPVHNGAEFLEECIESVLAQTYRNWHFVIVDNASTDATAHIAATWAAREQRITHVRFETLLEANANHNRAFRQASGESVYCKMLQADDWLYPECLEKMVAVAERHETVGVVGSFRLFGEHVDLTGLPYDTEQFAGRSILRQCLLGGPYVTGAPTATLIRSSLVRRRDPFYDPSFWHADTEGVYWALTVSDFGYVHQVLTFARRQEETRSSAADRMNSYVPENIRFLLRYGPLVLTDREFRRQLRKDLQYYVQFHIRQTPKPSRLRQEDFLRFHLAEVDHILEAGGEDSEIRAAMFAVRMMLGRFRLARRSVAAVAGGRGSREGR